MRMIRTFEVAMSLGLALDAARLARAAPPLAAGVAAGAVLVDGAVEHGGPVDAARLARLPQQSLPVTYATGQGVRSGRYQGVLLWDLLQQAGPLDQPGKHAALRHTVLVSGGDGYAVAFSFGELDPGGSADPVLLATQDGSMQLVVPDDRTGARDVHDVIRISIK